ncbi:multiple epidermal growth factor-like domains protein 6 [Ptychodera flava]|uniref:multiple epidermal growth factor-like domains protein 6 n=1 Tax=Ptychodera flava TaxID=63121 RepID=UPI00396A69CE
MTDYSSYPCQLGFYCPNGTEFSTQYGCPNGTYGTATKLEDVSQCDQCPEGKFCRGTGLSSVSGNCNAGFWCKGGASTPVPTDGVTGSLCPEGHYCISGTPAPDECPVGTWSDSTGLEAESDCQNCTGGYYCNGTGLTQPSGPCEPRYYCSSGAQTATPTDGVTGNPCTAGHYCPEGTTSPVPCDHGTYMTTTHAEECLVCPAARYCVTGLDPERCPAGYYCPEGTGWVWQSCPPGRFSDRDGLANETECQTCSAGMYCAHPNATGPSGYCDPGYFCVEGSDTPTPDGAHRGTAGICPEGHYCTLGTSTPEGCKRGTFSNNTKLTNETECTSCLYGKYCGSEGLTQPTGDCYGGFYCLRGARDPNNPTEDETGGPCPAGHFCPNGTSFPLGCLPGTYNSLEGQVECLPCEPGYWCPANATTYLSTVCPAGHYCPASTQYSTQYPCPAGTYNDFEGKQSIDDCKPCPPGEYCATAGLDTSTGSCSAGWYCIRGAWSDQPTDYGFSNITINCYCPSNSTGGQCEPGEFCPIGSSEPTPCLPGHYCEQSGLANVTGECDAGHYCVSGASVRNPTDGTTGDTCPTGHYCPQGIVDPVACPAGHFSNATGNTELSDCLACLPGHYCGDNGLSEPTGVCDAGYYCPKGQNVSRPEEFRCSPGHYCDAGSPEESPCASGEYQDEWGQSYCKTCRAGFYCDATIQNDTYCAHGVQNPQPCPVGHYCPLGTQYAYQYPCPNGTYSDVTHLESDSDCFPCPGGFYCGHEGLSAPSGECTAGYYCISGAYMSTPLDGVTGDICPTGAFCPAGSNSSWLCPPGTYNPTQGLRSEDECLACTPGEYCPQYGMDVTAGNCSAKYYCRGNASTPTPTDGVTGDVCPVGHYCPAGSSDPIPCEPGTFTDTTLNEECLPCTPGHYCITGSNPQDCPAGYYCQEGTGHVWQSCPLGTFSSQTGLANETMCTQCTAGFYCSQLNSTAETGPCDAGYYCRSGSDSQTPSSLSRGDAGICPAGFYCQQGTGEPEPCPPSTFNNRTGIVGEEECQDCLEGHYCEISGLEYPTGLCEEGFYCTLGSNSSRPSATSSSGGPCPPGTYCESGSSIPVACVAGTYNPIEAQSQCLDCPAGYHCVEGSRNITECPMGHFCPLNTEFDVQYPCNNGTYNNRTRGESVDDCELCPPGMYCPYQGMANPAGFCAPGWYCSLGAWKEKPTTLGNDTGDDCHCPAQSTGGMCQAGTFCPAGSSAPIPCTPGYYCLTDELATESGLCMAGYYCNGSTILPNPVNETTGDICPQGHYCPQGSAYPIACEPGTFSDRYANHYKNDCIPCTAGQYCTGWGRDLPNGDCDEGWFCPEGSTAAQPVGNQCLAGHACPVGSPDQSACPSGFYQPSVGQGTCIECPAGMYCDQNEAIDEQQSGVSAPSHGVVTPKDCPAGFYCLNGTETARQFPCPVSTYSNTTNLESESECRACPEGFYCEAENITQPTGLCAAGYYCVLYATTPTPDPADATGGPCPQGTYCESGSSWYSLCPKGTFGDSDKLPSEADCTDCYPGMYCLQPGLTAPNGSCIEGYYCQLRAINPNPVNESYGDICPSGNFCPEGSSQPTPCDAGTYQPYIARSNESDCLQCSPGKFCNGTGLSDESGLCYEGFYCMGGASSPAPRDGVTGDICPPGSYCEAGSPGHTFCPNGTFMNHSMASACYDCPAGHYCVNRDRADLCPPGNFCPERTGADLGLCPSGTYNPIYGIYSESQCLQCDGGKYCKDPGSSNVTGNCSPGYYCRYGVNMEEPNGGHTGDGAICPPGHYCPEGSPDPIGCPSGSYNELPGQAVCQQCPQGYYCLENATTHTETICPTGHYCPPGTTYDREYPCPMGTYNPVNGSNSLDDCLECPPGQYCENDGLEQPTGNCSEGWYCTGGSYTSKPLPFSNATDISECTCPLVNYTGGRCWPGTYCEGGASYPVECDEGMYCREWGRAEPNGECDEGYYCDGGESLPDPAHGLCPPGHFCIKGSATPTPCPAELTPTPQATSKRAIAWTA